MTSFGGMISELGSAIAIIPLLGILENVAIAKAFGNLTIEFITNVQLQCISDFIRMQLKSFIVFSRPKIK